MTTSRYISFRRLAMVPGDLMAILMAATWSESDDQQDAIIIWDGVQYHARNCAIPADGDRCDLSLERMWTVDANGQPLSD